MSAGLAWLGIWSLAAGWLLLTDFFLAPDAAGLVDSSPPASLLFVLAGRRVRWRQVRALVVPVWPCRWCLAALVWPLPYRAGPLLILAGLLLALPLRRAGWLAPLSLGLGLAGAVWIAQGGATVADWWLGARYHEATFLAPLISGLARLLGWTAGSSEGALFLPHVEGTIQATTTWERLGLWPLLLAAAGGLALLPLLRREGSRRRALRLAAALAAGLVMSCSATWP